MKKITFILLFSATLFSQNSKYEIGEQLYFAKGCSSCHGTKATGLHSYPSLAHRSKWDLKRRLLKFRSGVENNQQSLIMIPFAKTLSKKDIDNISYFLENLKDEQDAPIYEVEFEAWGDGGS